jgi:hypothetical protein
MVDEFRLDREVYARLEMADVEIAAAVAQGGCRWCGGPLHRADYERKPRGGLVAPVAEEWKLRIGLCCGRRGCRRRATPPSVRFLGRRVYVGAVVIIASVVALALRGRALAAETGVPARTARRWSAWWRAGFPSTSLFAVIAGRIVPALRRAELPRSLLERFLGAPTVRMERLLAVVAPLTTTSVADGSRFVRGAL